MIGFNADRVRRVIREEHRLPDLEEMTDAPVAWFPIKLSNPTKLTAHVWDGRDWRETVYVRVSS